MSGSDLLKMTLELFSGVSPQSVSASSSSGIPLLNMSGSSQAPGGASATANQDLASLFECPVCFDYVLPPILQVCSTILVQLMPLLRQIFYRFSLVQKREIAIVELCLSHNATEAQTLEKPHQSDVLSLEAAVAIL